MANWLKATYERLFDDGSGKMKISRGRIHDYLGMNLDFNIPGQVKVTMFPYVKEIVQLFQQSDDNTRTAKTPAAEHLFQVNDDSPPLTEHQATTFHNFVAKCLFLTKRARPDISTAEAFLTTRVKGPDQDDWKKLT
jgi:hypothetical protein